MNINKKSLRISLLLAVLLSFSLVINVFAEEISHITTLDDLNDGFVKMDVSTKLSPYRLSNTLLVSIVKSDYEFIRIESLLTGVKLKRDTFLAKTLESSSIYSELYEFNSNDPNYLKLKNGFFKLQNDNGNDFYAIDPDGNLLTGFVYAVNQKYYNFDNANNLVSSDSSDAAVYYFNNFPGPAYGTLNSVPVTIDGIYYIFDSQGRLIDGTLLSSIDNPNNDDVSLPVFGTWEFNPDNRSWYYYRTDDYGNRQYLKDGVYKINVRGENYYYMFDENGKMKTGLIKYKGNTYYLQEYGMNQGAVYVGEITIKGVPYVFNEQGIMISSMNKDMKTTNNKRYAK